MWGHDPDALLKELADQSYIPDVTITIDGRVMFFDFKTANPNPNVNQEKLYEELMDITRPKCPHCGELAPYGDRRIGWSDWHESRKHRLWWWFRRHILWDR
jgi:hypothetical protein